MTLKGNRREKQAKEKKEKKKEEKKKKERRKRKKEKKKEKQIFSLIEKNHKNIWKWKFRSNGGVAGNFKIK